MPERCREWRVEIRRRAARRLKRHPQLYRRLSSLVEELKCDPYSAADKLRRGRCAGMFARRLGDYRVIYTVHEEECIIVIECVGPRERVYEECC